MLCHNSETPRKPCRFPSRYYRKQALLYFTFLSRLYNYEDETLRKVEEYLGRTGRNLQTIHRLFYDVFQRGFCTKSSGKVTINFHTFMHLDEVQKKTGPLWRNSTESFESMYGVMRRCYKVGTPNTSKQAMENFYLRDMYNSEFVVFYWCFREKSLSFQLQREPSVQGSGEVGAEAFARKEQKNSGQLCGDSPGFPRNLPGFRQLRVLPPNPSRSS